MFITCLVSVLLSLLITFPFCYECTSAFYRLTSLNESIYNLIWYKLPVKYQPYIGMMLTPVQNVRELSGYDLIACSLETFRKVKMLTEKVSCIDKYRENMFFVSFVDAENGWIAVCNDQFALNGTRVNERKERGA